ncbi:sigma-54-dependent Fis family transcriptional regulator [Sporocytophaga myxococcoides]|uniref:sigma-54-dependent Fis family transcriptional regulator n=1 Tax=Sporocytophaga myxococcoides TaxID=153721 RepID=UPI00042013A6|nr:sigma 54-interacting transcriptional regulator [Sporocytophaga myxococcoides]
MKKNNNGITSDYSKRIALARNINDLSEAIRFFLYNEEQVNPDFMIVYRRYEPGEVFPIIQLDKDNAFEDATIDPENIRHFLQQIEKDNKVIVTEYDPAYEGKPKASKKQLNNSDLIFAPLKINDQWIGFACLKITKTNKAARELLTACPTFFDLTAIGVSNILREEELQRKNEEKSLQLSLSHILASSKDWNEIFKQTSVELKKYAPLDFFALCLQSNGDLVRTCMFSRQSDNLFVNLDDRKDSVIGEFSDAELKKELEAIVHLNQEPTLYATHEYVELCCKSRILNLNREKFKISTAVFIPVTLKNHDNALLMLASCVPDAFNCTHLQLFSSIAPQVSMALNNILAFEEIENLKKRLELENTCLIEEVNTNADFEEIVGSSISLKQIFRTIKQVAPTDSTVLIQGETGTGKELIARAIHNHSQRKHKVMVKINCAALPANLIESELFGHEKGSFTGAFERRIGKFEMADKGTIFLDEIGELPLELQSKLLRVLQEKEFERIGGNKTIKTDVRIIAATNRNLQKQVNEGKFRADLYYRLNVFPVSLPPLRERKEDIPLLANYFAQRFAKKMQKSFLCIKEKAMLELMNYQFPGNIRELENIIEHAVIISDGKPLDWGRQLSGNHSKQKITALSGESGVINGTNEAIRTINQIKTEKDNSEREGILSALSQTHWRIRGDRGAAELLKVKPTTLEARMKKLGISKKVL